MATVETIPIMASRDGVISPRPNMAVTLVHGSTVNHDGFHFSSMMSSLERTFGVYDPNNLTASINVCDQVYESAQGNTFFIIDQTRFYFMNSF